MAMSSFLPSTLIWLSGRDDLKAPAVLDEGITDKHWTLLMGEAHRATWFHVRNSSDTGRSTRGSRPG
eukprot:6777045-Pyramimonas_sp.AAC.1